MTPAEPPDAPGPDGRPPLPPEDRVWRHPSEMGWGAGIAGGGAPPIRPQAAIPQPPPRRGRTPLLVVGSMLVGAGLAVLGVYAAGLAGQPPTTEVIERVEQPRPVSAVDRGAFEAALDRQVLPAVGRLDARSPQGRTTATAIAFRSDGHLLTTHDAVSGAESLSVTLADGREFDATLVGTDPVTDLAVVKIDATDVPTVLLGSVRDLQLGEPVFAVDAARGGAGAPAVTGGVISKLGDRVDVEGAAPLEDMIATNTGTQVTTAGAAVIDSSGAVIGIGTSRRATGAVAVATEAPLSRYATPIEYARSVAGELIERGEVHHVWLGIESGSPGGPTSGARGVTVGDGAPVRTVEPGSPAAAAGILEGDVVSAVDDVRVTDLSSLAVTIRGHDPGDVVRVTLERDGARVVVDVTLAERPAL